MSGKARSSSESSSSDSEALSIKDDEGNFCVQNRIIRSDKKYDHSGILYLNNDSFQCRSWSKSKSKNSCPTGRCQLESKFYKLAGLILILERPADALRRGRSEDSKSQRLCGKVKNDLGWLHLYRYNESKQAKKTILLI